MKKILCLLILIFFALLAIKIKIVHNERNNKLPELSNVIISTNPEINTEFVSPETVVLTKQIDKTTTDYQKTLNVFTIVWIIGFVVCFIIFYLIFNKS